MDPPGLCGGVGVRIPSAVPLKIKNENGVHVSRSTRTARPLGWIDGQVFIAKRLSPFGH